MRFDRFINEAIFNPDTKFVYAALDSIKEKLLNTKNIKEVDKLMNAAFNEYWIVIYTSKLPDDECTNSQWSIHSGFTTPNNKSDIGSIVSLTLGKEFFKKLEIAKTNWKGFCDGIESIIGHEFIHVFQVTKIAPTSYESVFKEQTSDEGYISQKHEIPAFAFQAVKEFMMAGYTPEQVIKRIQYPFDEKMKPGYESSDAFWSYVFFFHENDKKGILKRFLNAMYEYCQKFM